MTSLFPTTLPTLPLLLWDVPPGLERILSQEGVPFSKVRDPHPLAFQAGRFVLYDGRRVPPSVAHATLSADHVPINVDLLRRGEPIDPFQALVDNRARPATWEIGGLELTERVSRFPKAEIRRRLIRKLQHAVAQAGGIWTRLSPYRSCRCSSCTPTPAGCLPGRRRAGRVAFAFVPPVCVRWLGGTA